jgi:hypothetical protein
MQRLDGMDASFVYLDTPATPMHVGTTCVFDPSTAPDEYSFHKVRRLMEDRLHLIRRSVSRSPSVQLVASSPAPERAASEVVRVYQST